MPLDKTTKLSNSQNERSKTRTLKQSPQCQKLPIWMNKKIKEKLDEQISRNDSSQNSKYLSLPEGSPQRLDVQSLFKRQKKKFWEHYETQVPKLGQVKQKSSSTKNEKQIKCGGIEWQKVTGGIGIEGQKLQNPRIRINIGSGDSRSEVMQSTIHIDKKSIEPISKNNYLNVFLNQIVTKAGSLKEERREQFANLKSNQQENDYSFSSFYKSKPLTSSRGRNEDLSFTIKRKFCTTNASSNDRSNVKEVFIQQISPSVTDKKKFTVNIKQYHDKMFNHIKKKHPEYNQNKTNVWNESKSDLSSRSSNLKIIPLAIKTRFDDQIELDDNFSDISIKL